MDEYPNQLGLILKSLRHARKWSLSQAAEQTGVSKAMLGQIERRESSPTVATLWKIATGFSVPFSFFIPPDPAQAALATIRSGNTRSWQQHHESMRVTPLFPFDAGLRFDMLTIELAAGKTSHSSPHDTGVVEHVVVLQGDLQLAVNGIWHTLNTGEGLRFQADCAHSYRNGGSQPVMFYSLIHYPQRELCNQRPPAADLT